MPDQTDLRVAVVGLGVMGRTHVAVLTGLAGVAVTAVSDVDPIALAAVADATGAVAVDDPLALVAAADVDAVLVASPDATHAPLVLAALDRGLPVLCEKPLTTSVDDTLAVLDRERAAGRRLVQVGFMRRFDPGFAAVRDAVASGQTGPPALVRTVHRNPVASYAFSPQVLVLNSASHDVDLVRWCTGEEVAAVTATTAPGADERSATVLLTMVTTSGVLAVTELTYGPSCGYVVGAEVVGPGGAAATPPGAQDDGDWVTRFADAYRAQDLAWTSALRSGADLPGAGALDALESGAVLAAAGRSLETGRTVVVERPAGGPSAAAQRPV